MERLTNRRRSYGSNLTPLCLTAIENTTFSVTIRKNTSDYQYLEYSIDGGNTWVKTLNDDSIDVVVTTPTITAGDSVFFRGLGHTLGIITTNAIISSDGKFTASGDLSSLVGGTANLTYASSSNAFRYLFLDCKLTDASELYIPAAVAQGQYMGMFYNCSLLEYGPKSLPSRLSKQCFYSAFRGCTSLKEAPTLPATTLADQCYQMLFNGCTSLTQAPVLPATRLEAGCYSSMFAGCSSLTYIKAMFLDEPSTTYMQWWVQGVPSGGTFVKNANATWENTFDRFAIPTGWTVETAIE